MPEVTKDMINEAWSMADLNRDKELDGEEYTRIVRIAGGPPEGEMEGIKWYWNHFVQDKKGGMTRREYGSVFKHYVGHNKIEEGTEHP